MIEPSEEAAAYQAGRRPCYRTAPHCLSLPQIGPALLPLQLPQNEPIDPIGSARRTQITALLLNMARNRLICQDR